jgi:hypothetical protein
MKKISVDRGMRNPRRVLYCQGSAFGFRESQRRHFFPARAI